MLCFVISRIMKGRTTIPTVKLMACTIVHSYCRYCYIWATGFKNTIYRSGTWKLLRSYNRLSSCIRCDYIGGYLLMNRCLSHYMQLALFCDFVDSFFSMD